MKLIVGLGNPGDKYLHTRHNIGFEIIEQLAKKLLAADFQEENKFKATISKKEDLIFAKPLTFMNLSGEAVQKIANFYKIPPTNIIVIYDDVDLPLGKIRIRPEGGAGTHNGMKSIIKHLGPNFVRVRVGIETRGELTPEQMTLHDFVLGRFNPAEQKALPGIIKRAGEATNAIIEKGPIEAMNQFN